MTQKEQTGTSSDTLYVGIDLGTSRSSISASNASTAWIESYVGWPKDFISAKVLGKQVMFGAEALEHRLSLEMCRPMERGVIKEGIDRNEDAVKEIIKELIRLVKPHSGQKIKAIVGVPADTMKVNKLAIRKAVADYVHSIMVVSEPFAVAYSMDLLDNAFIIDIGAGTVDFCIMHGTMPDESDQKDHYHGRRLYRRPALQPHDREIPSLAIYKKYGAAVQGAFQLRGRCVRRDQGRASS